MHTSQTAAEAAAAVSGAEQSSAVVSLENADFSLSL